MTRTSRRTRIATAAVLAPLALGLVACGGDDDVDDAPMTSTSGTAAPDDSAVATVEGDVETAAQTALAELDGTVVSIDWGRLGWDVTIATTDGIEHEFQLSLDGTAVESGPVEDDQDADDLAETERLVAVALDHTAAIEAASAEVQGTVTGVELSEDDGRAIWEVQTDEDTPDETTVELDAETGEVLRVEQGD